MNVLVHPVPLAIFLGLAGLVGFLWSIAHGQFDDLDGAAVRVLDDSDIEDRRDVSNAFASARAGAVDCVCPPGSRLAGTGILGRAGLGWLTVGAAASVLSQTLMYGLLPLAGAMHAPEPALVPVPFVALLVGAVAATFPAAILRDAFGRRAAFALGASLGVAGGLVLAFGLTAAAFWPIVLGAFWIGVANGFALQYRHAAAAGLASGDAARSIAVVVGASAVVGIVAPLSASFFEAGLVLLGAGTATPRRSRPCRRAGRRPGAPRRGRRARRRGGGSDGRRRGRLARADRDRGARLVRHDGDDGRRAARPRRLRRRVHRHGRDRRVARRRDVCAGRATGLLTSRLGVFPTAIAGLGLMGGAAITMATAGDALAIAAALIVNGVGWSLATSASSSPSMPRARHGSPSAPTTRRCSRRRSRARSCRRRSSRYCRGRGRAAIARRQRQLARRRCGS